MTSSWNNFSIGKVDLKESTTPPATQPTEQHTTLNLASLGGPQREAPKPVAPAPASSGNSLLDAGSGFATGIGKQAIGTLDSLFGADKATIQKNLAQGGAGSHDGINWFSAATKMAHGISDTVSLAYNNPDAIIALPGQLVNQFKSGDARTRGDMLGQATFIVGSMFVGGGGASKAGNIAGDLREVSTMTKGVNALTDASNTMRSLETTVTGLRGSTVLGDASAVAKSSNLLADASALTRSTGLTTDVAALTRGTNLSTDVAALTRGTNLTSDAAALTRGTGFATDAGNLGRNSSLLTDGAGLSKTGSFAERVLPATEGSTKFLVKGETASSLGVSEMSLPNRLLGLQTTEQGAGVFSKFLGRFKAAESETAGLAGKVGPLPKLGTSEIAGAASNGSKIESVATTISRAESGLTSVAPKVEGLTSVAPKVEGLTSVAPKVEGLSGAVPNVEGLPGVVQKVEGLPGAVQKVEGLPGAVQKIEGVPGAVQKVEGLPGVVQKVEGLPGAVQKVETLPGSIARAETGATRVEGLANATRVESLTTQVSNAEKVTSAVSNVEKATAELSTKFGARASVSELEVATKQLSQAASATEKAQAFAAVERATAKVVSELPAEVTTALRGTVDSLKAPLQIASKSEAAEVIATQIADRSTALSRQVSELGSTTASPAVRELSTATREFAEATTATEKARAFANVEKATAKVATEVPAETANALRNTVESLRTPVSTAARGEIAEVAATQIAERSSQLTAQTSELAATYEARASVQELNTAARQLAEATTAAEKVQALSAVERASVKVAQDIPEAGAAVRQTVEGLKAPLQTAVKAEAAEVVATQVAQRSTQLIDDAARLTEKFGENPAVRELNVATREFTQAASAAEKAEAFARVERAANVVREISPEGAQVARTVESLSAPVETAARAQRIERAVAQVDDYAAALSKQTKTLAQELTVEGKVPTSVQNLDNAAARMSQATTTAEKAEAFGALQRSAAEVATEFPGKSAQITKTVESMAPQVQAAERLTQVENVSSRLAYQADDIAREASLLKSGSTLKNEAALADLQQSANAYKTATAAERTEQLSQMNKNLRLVEAEVGEAKAAGLRTSVARLENEAGTFERVAAVDKSVGAVSSQSQFVARQASELEAATASTTAREALQNIQKSANELGGANALNRTEQLSVHARDLATIEREMGTAAAGQMRTALSDLDRATFVSRAQHIELVEYQGAKIAQQVGYLSEGSLGSRTQALRLEQVQHDLSVMKSVVPADSPIAPHLSRLETQISGVDAIANILAHPEVSRAPGKELLRLAESADSATATAAADRLILKGKFEALGDGPVSGLLSERAQFWNAQKQLGQLEDVARTKLFESGRLFGLPVGDPVFKKALFDIAATAGGIALLDGSIAYNLSKLNAMARDNVLTAEQNAKAREQEQPRKDAEIKPTEVKSANAVPNQGTSTGTTSGGNVNVTSGGAVAADGTRQKAADAASQANQGDSYVRTSQQAAFHNDPSEVKLSPASQVYATPKFLPSDETNNIPAGSFPVAGASWWWKQQHGGNPWGFNRGPGVGAAPVEEAKPTATNIPRARGMSVTPDADLTKIAQTRFPIPRVLDISNQFSLLNSTNQFAMRSEKGSFGASGNGAPARSWTTVDWSQIGSHRMSASEGGKGNQDLSKLEKDEEVGIEVSGGGAASTTTVASGHGNNDPNTSDPSAISASSNDPNSDPNTVVASNSLPQPEDDENFAKI